MFHHWCDQIPSMFYTCMHGSGQIWHTRKPCWRITRQDYDTQVIKTPRRPTQVGQQQCLPPKNRKGRLSTVAQVFSTCPGSVHLPCNPEKQKDVQLFEAVRPLESLTSSRTWREEMLPSKCWHWQFPHSDGRSSGFSGLTTVSWARGGAKSPRPSTKPCIVWSMSKPTTTMCLLCRTCKHATCMFQCPRKINENTATRCGLCCYLMKTGCGSQRMLLPYTCTSVMSRLVSSKGLVI